MFQPELKEQVIEKLENASLIIKDNLSFLYLRSANPGSLKKHKLGDGAISSTIALFSLLNFISKVYFILKKGNSIISSESNVKEYEQLKEKIKINNGADWNKIKSYFKKPRIGEINETEAFVFLIENCPLNFGIDKKNKTEIEHVWKFYRNNLTHMISLSGESFFGQQISMLESHSDEESNYLKQLEFINIYMDIYPPFALRKESDTQRFRNIPGISEKYLQNISKDQCYPDTLNIQCKNLIAWLVTEINEGNIPPENFEILLNWVNNHLKKWK